MKTLTKPTIQCYMQNSYNRWQYWNNVVNTKSWVFDSLSEGEASENMSYYEALFYRYMRMLRNG